MLADYDTISFRLGNECEYDRTPCPIRNTRAIRSVLGNVESFEDVFLIHKNLFLPRDYFCPLDFSTRLLLYKTENTRAIHWAASSWFDEKQRKASRRQFFLSYPTGIFIRILGLNRYNKLKSYIKSCSILDFVKNLRKNLRKQK